MVRCRRTGYNGHRHSYQTGQPFPSSANRTPPTHRHPPPHRPTGTPTTFYREWPRPESRRAVSSGSKYGPLNSHLPMAKGTFSPPMYKIELDTL
ncbi:MAG: hypothetical protein KME26_04825 [Oscillatoria princeps RMCB-10]|nr:hypothetical protein [Oscillatoria princeps RMCB-10]